MGQGFVIIDTKGFPIGFVTDLDPWLDMLKGLGVTCALDDDGIRRLYNPSGDLLAMVHKLDIGI